MHTNSKVDHMETLIQQIRTAAGPQSRIVFVSGTFNVLHPGHLRLLNFAAECGDYLVVGVNNDSYDGVHVSQQLRLAGVRSIGIVNHAFVLEESLETVIRILRPDAVIKGKEHEHKINSEKAVLESYGGRLLFSSGEVRFSSLDLIQRELKESDLSTIHKPLDYPKRHSFGMVELMEIVQKFSGIRVVVIGDLIVDEYINCEPLGMSQEDPTIVVSPIRSDKFIGGAGIVAAHARGLGAQVSFLTVVGEDNTSRFAQEQLRIHDVNSVLVPDASRPTTLKQRYRARNKTLLRVSHLRQHDISQTIADRLFSAAAPLIADADLFIFSDFNYGVLPQSLVDRLAAECKRHDVMMAADSQSSSQVGDVSRFRGMGLLTPTEHEARLAVRDFGSGLVVLADMLREKAQAREIIVKLGSEGVLIHAPKDNSSEWVTDKLPAFNSAPKDVSGAGDSLLICVALALAVGTDIWRSAYLGSVAAACQVGRVGNIPLAAKELLEELSL